MRCWEVGGCVRDKFAGRISNDVDFAVEAASFHRMCETLDEWGFKEFTANPEFVTSRRQVPEDHPLYKRTKVADFVLCRKDGTYTDGRRPDWVETGTIYDDLARRDFTMNAIAYDPIAEMYLDPHKGEADIEQRLIRFVGNPMTRINEDGLRVLRGFRFAATLDFTFSPGTGAALRSPEAAEMLAGVAIERVDAELRKMLGPESFERGFEILSQLPTWTRKAIFRDGLRLAPTLKEK